MAERVLNPVVGQFVYEPFSPQKVGVIRSVKFRKTPYPSFFVSVEWVTKKGAKTIQTGIDSSSLQDLQSLITDHQKKLQTHLDSKTRLQKILHSETN